LLSNTVYQAKEREAMEK